MLIGLAGRAGAGKDTFGSCLAEQYSKRYHNWPARTVSFAGTTQMWRSAITALGISDYFDIDQDLIDQFKRNAFITVEGLDDEFHLTGREYIQHFGTEAHRDIFGEDFWVDRLFQSQGGEQLNLPKELIIVTDVRFENEAQAIIDAGGFIIMVCRDSGEYSGQEHSSEQMINAFEIDMFVENKGTKEELLEKANWVFEMIEEKICNFGTEAM